MRYAAAPARLRAICRAGQLRTEKVEERFLCPDWLAADPADPFASVMGDGSSNLLPRERVATRTHLETLAAPRFEIEDYGCDYNGAAEHPIYALRRRPDP